jgi:hypothetical protein
MMTPVTPRLQPFLARLTLLGTCLIVASQALAQDAGTESDFKLSGYASLVAGKLLSGKLDAQYTGPLQINGLDCPCYVADWSNAGLYGKDLSLSPESRLGIQGTYTFNPQASVTAQLVSRGTHGAPDVAWAYGSYRLNSVVEIQVGRKRIPFYYYSDFQDIGVAYPWISPPPELYGWDVTNYNGASVRYRGTVGDANVTSSVFAGQEKNSDSLYQKLYLPGKTEVQWNNLLGVDLEVMQGPLTLRAVAMQADVRIFNNDRANDTPGEDLAALKAYGLAINLDFDKWFVLSEFTRLIWDHPATQINDPYKVTAPSFTVGAGMRLGKWTPFINYAQYHEGVTGPGEYTLNPYGRTSLTLRYDLDAISAVKVQLDKALDSANNYGGDATVLRLSYDRVF